MKIDIDRHGPGLIPNNCQHLDPPYFSLLTTFKETVELDVGCVGTEFRVTHPWNKETHPNLLLQLTVSITGLLKGKQN